LRTWLMLALGAALLAVTAPAAAATDYTAGPPVVATPATSPFDPCAAEPDSQDDPNFENTSVEPLVAVNPTDQNNVVGVFQEDRWYDGGAHGLMAGVSLNGGSSYASSFATFSSCSFGADQLPRATDPWVSFDKAGRAYQVALSVNDASLTKGAITTAYSDDDGSNWSDPVDVTRVADPTGIVFLDKESITADPYTTGRAWTTWIQGNLPGENISFNKLVHAFSYRGTPMVSRTTDGGNTWSAPAAMTNASIYAQGNQIVVEPDGTLLDVQAVLFKGSGAQHNGNGTFVAVMRSKDGGKTWSMPSKIAPLQVVPESADGHPLRVGDYLPDIEVDPSNGNVYVTWADSMGGSTNKIVFSRSTDEGKHWSAPMIVSSNDTAQSFNDAVAVGHDGEVAVLYMDDASNNNTTTADGIPTDVYLRHSSDGGQTWSDPQKLYTFDFSKAPDTQRGYFVGDYQGLTGIGDHDLLAFFGVSGSTANSSKVVSIRLSGS
jgi:hypothetical protein